MTTLSKLEDIALFYRSGKRAENDALNRLRERAFMVLNDPEHAFFKDTVHGAKWLALLSAVRAYTKDYLTRKGYDTNYTRFQIEQRGGLSEHYDLFITLYYALDTRTMKFEFKYKSMPQFANLYDKDAFIEGPTLPEFWYDYGWIDKIVDVYADRRLSFPKPSREEYIKGANKMLGPKSPPSFFKQFRDCDESADQVLTKEKYKKRVKIDHDGIRAYLEQYGSKINIKKLCDRFAETEKDKVYGIWNPTKQAFAFLEYTKEQLTPTEFLRIDNGNTIVLKAGDSEMHLRLRWKNGMGLTTPAWQVKLNKPRVEKTSVKKPRAKKPRVEKANA
jgi:phage pi2 protein 07